MARATETRPGYNKLDQKRNEKIKLIPFYYNSISPWANLSKNLFSYDLFIYLSLKNS